MCFICHYVIHNTSSSTSHNLNAAIIMEVIIILTLTSVSGSGALATSVIKTFHFINVISVNYWLHNSVKLVNKTIIMFSGISDTIATCTGSISNNCESSSQ